MRSMSIMAGAMGLVALAAGLAAPAGPARAAIVERTLQGSVTEVVAASGLAVGDTVTTTLTFDDATPVVPGLYQLTALTITLPGLTLGLADDARGSPFPLVGWDGVQVTGLDFDGAVAAAVYGYAAGALEFVAPTDLSFIVLDANLGATAFSGILTPVPAALPLLASGVLGLGLLAARRRRT